MDFLGNEDVYRQISPLTLTRSKTDRLLVAENVVRSFDEAKDVDRSLAFVRKRGSYVGTTY